MIKSAGAVRSHQTNELRNTVIPRGPSLALRAIHLVLRLRRAAGMCSSKESDTANRLRKIRK